METIEQELKESAVRLDTWRGYPMWFTCKEKSDTEAEITMADTRDHVPGEVYSFYVDNTWRYYHVVEITEKRPARGNHPQPTTFFRLKCEILPN